jgi:hypothetical protein
MIEAACAEPPRQRRFSEDLRRGTKCLAERESAKYRLYYYIIYKQVMFDHHLAHAETSDGRIKRLADAA